MGFLFKIYAAINNRILFDAEKEHPSVQEQKKFLHSFAEPGNVTERSFYKYQCLMFYSYSKGQRIFMNFISFLALGLLILLYRARGIRHDKFMKGFQPRDILLRKATKRIPITDIFPEALNACYPEAVDYDGVSYSEIFITGDAFSRFWKAVKAHPFYFHYHMVVLLRLAQASFLLCKYAPKCITTYVCEREFADPILTEYFELHQVQYHGFMHGDYLYSIEQAFMYFSKYWLWGEHYRTLFKSMRCAFDTEIYTPKKWAGIVKPRKSMEDYDYYATYYFSNEKKESIEILKDAFLKLKSRGHKCKVRPHPRFSNVNMIKDIFGKEFEVEDTSKIAIEESLECSYITIALISTVLTQAYYSGKKVVIDDISDPKVYEQLREKEYILIDKADMLFSELLERGD